MYKQEKQEFHNVNRVKTQHRFPTQPVQATHYNVYVRTFGNTKGLRWWYGAFPQHVFSQLMYNNNPSALNVLFDEGENDDDDNNNNISKNNN